MYLLLLESKLEVHQSFPILEKAQSIPMNLLLHVRNLDIQYTRYTLIFSYIENNQSILMSLLLHVRMKMQITIVSGKTRNPRNLNVCVSNIKFVCISLSRGQCLESR